MKLIGKYINSKYLVSLIVLKKGKKYLELRKKTYSSPYFLIIIPVLLFSLKVAFEGYMSKFWNVFFSIGLVIFTIGYIIYGMLPKEKKVNKKTKAFIDFFKRQLELIHD